MRHVVHFDVKTDNLLGDLRDLSNPVVKIADMGLSKRKATTFVSGNMRGTLPWMAPELFPNAASFAQVGATGVFRPNIRADTGRSGKQEPACLMGLSGKSEHPVPRPGRCLHDMCSSLGCWRWCLA